MVKMVLDNKITNQKFNDDFKDLMEVASDLTEAGKNDVPVFQNVQGKLKDFAAKTMKSMDAKAKVCISSLKDKMYTRSTDPNNLDLDPAKNTPLVINWIVNILKSVLEKLDEQGDMIKVHTEALKDPKDILNVAKNEEVEALKVTNDKLRVEIDETRQRGLKGNIIVSSPVRPGKDTCFKPKQLTEGGNQVKEADIDMVLRLIEEKTLVAIPKEDVIACHPMGRREKNTFIITVNNRKPGSAWERLTAAMMKSSIITKDCNVFVNFQLTKERGALAKVVRLAKTAGRISNYSVDQNGKIKIKKNGDAKEYIPVTSEEHMNGML